MEIAYQIENHPSAAEFIECLIESTLGERRPVTDFERIKKMIDNANLIITARADGQLVGIARSVTDFSYCTYLSDLAVRKNFQRRGIGRELIRRTKLAGGKAKLILLSAPAAIDYYPKIGMKKHDHCFILNDVRELI
ncbi:MAG: GNAT family N-acetyltransferase [Ignavibacteriae bacterium HGW-Ignavibacteriae-3]|nr:MAG: GNAT family N-acetyltransferase [Ignavibacteriae bacterium HGW-Ignavibacteriae-3]